MLAPARMPVAAGKKMAKTEKNVSSRKSGPMFSHIIEPEEVKKQGRRLSGKKDKNLSQKEELDWGTKGGVCWYHRSQSSRKVPWT